MRKYMISVIMLLFSTTAFAVKMDYKLAYYESTVEVAKLVRHKTILENFVGDQYLQIKLLNAQLQSMKEVNQETLHRQITLGELCNTEDDND